MAGWAACFMTPGSSLAFLLGPPVISTHLPSREGANGWRRCGCLGLLNKDFGKEEIKVGTLGAFLTFFWLLMGRACGFALLQTFGHPQISVL